MRRLLQELSIRRQDALCLVVVCGVAVLREVSETLQVRQRDGDRARFGAVLPQAVSSEEVEPMKGNT